MKIEEDSSSILAHTYSTLQRTLISYLRASVPGDHHPHRQSYDIAQRLTQGSHQARFGSGICRVGS
jgi:hypothetical protein